MIGRAADAAKAAMWRIYQYTRSQAVADGFQIEVTKTAEEAGNRHEVAHHGRNHIGHHRLPCCVPTPGTKSDLHEWITPLGARRLVRRTRNACFTLGLALRIMPA